MPETGRVSIADTARDALIMSADAVRRAYADLLNRGSSSSAAGHAATLPPTATSTWR